MNAHIDLSPIVNGVVIPLLTPLLLVFATWALNKVAAYAHFQIQDGQRQVVGDAIANGLAYAEQKLAPYENVTADQKVAAAVNYVLPKVPGALKTLGVTPEHLAQLVTAKLSPSAPASVSPSVSPGVSPGVSQ
jgi:hypothetical protein